MLSHKSESVQVLIRCRPFSQTELVNRSLKCTEIQPIDQRTHRCVIKLMSPRKSRRRISRLFRFDAIYDESHRTEDIFHDFIQSLVYDVTLYGYSGTVFAYGQTGSGRSMQHRSRSIPLARSSRQVVDYDRLFVPFGERTGVQRHRMLVRSRSTSASAIGTGRRVHYSMCLSRK